jgi:hypothetical protein
LDGNTNNQLNQQGEILTLQQKQEAAALVRNQLSDEQSAILSTITTEGKTQAQLTSEIASALGISQTEAGALAAVMVDVSSQTGKAADGAEREADAAERTLQARRSTAQQFAFLSASAQQLDDIFSGTLGTQQDQTQEIQNQINLVALQIADAERAASIFDQNLQSAVAVNQTVAAQIGDLRIRSNLLREGAESLRLELERLKEAKRIQEELIPILEQKIQKSREELGIAELLNELYRVQITQLDKQIEAAQARGASEQEINRLQKERTALIEEQEELQIQLMQLKREEQILDLELLILKEQQEAADERRIKNLNAQLAVLRQIARIEAGVSTTPNAAPVTAAQAQIDAAVAAFQSTLPAFATGGIVDRPTVALIGEGGEREYVIPQSNLQSMATGIQSGDPSTIRALQSTGIQLGGSQMVSPQVSVSGMSDSNIVAGLDDVKNLLRANLMMGSNGGQTQGIPNRQNKLREFVLMGS